jgi:hypothetical protein
MDINAAQIVLDGMRRFVEMIVHRPSLHHSAYSLRTGQCVSCVVTAVVTLSCVRCEQGFVWTQFVAQFTPDFLRYSSLYYCHERQN